jgi:hypothetical protein
MLTPLLAYKFSVQVVADSTPTAAINIGNRYNKKDVSIMGIICLNVVHIKYASQKTTSVI